MTHKLKLIFEGNNSDFDKDLFQKSLPNRFEVKQENGDYYIYVDQDEKQLNYIVNRELDRHYFLTYVKIKAVIIKPIIISIHTCKYRSQGTLPINIEPQKWSNKDNNLSQQLRLWSLADEIDDIVSKTILLFHIIEITYPDTTNKKDYPAYTNSSTDPDPKTECKLIRHLVAHAGKVQGSELKNYCRYLGLPERMLDHTDPKYIEIITNKINFIETQAKLVIKKSL